MEVSQETKIKYKARGLSPRGLRAPKVSGLVKYIMEKLKDE